jgi:hypothetical protein
VARENACEHSEANAEGETIGSKAKTKIGGAIMRLVKLGKKMANTSTVRIPRIAPAVAKKLGNYVYLYKNPLDGKVFYVGKGTNKRALAHLRAGEKMKITKKLKAIRAAGEEPRIEILAHGLPTPDVALKVEAAAIDLLGLKGLVNAVGGHGATYGRMPIEEVIAHYTRRKVKVREHVILIRINKLYRYGMTDAELYDATRSAWRVGPKRSEARYAVAVFEGVGREVYKITQWLPAGSTFNTRRDTLGLTKRDRRVKWEFVGIVADEKIRKRYINHYVGHLFAQGAQNPISYVVPPRKTIGDF